MMVAADDPNGDGAPATVSRRRAARLAAVQALYELGVNGGDVEDIIIDYRNERPGAVFEGNEFAETDHDLFADVVRGVVRRNMEVREQVAQALTSSWSFDRLETVLRDVMCCGAYELMMRPDVPGRVIINEYMEVAHAFFSGDEPAMVNAVLDRIARQLRTDEFDAGGRKRPA